MYSEYQNVNVGELSELSGTELYRDLVAAVHQGGIADIMQVPDSPDDMDKDLTHMVMFIDIEMHNGEKRTLVFKEDEVRHLFEISNEYRKALMSKPGKESGIPDEIKDLMRKIRELGDPNS